MRVISGECKGRPLKAVPGKNTRPTTDKVKESIFNLIGPYFKGGTGLDLFAGSGGLAIEALSRGIDRMILVDRDPKAVETIRENLTKCDFQNRAEVYRNDASRALKAVAKRQLSLNLVLLDPPYKKQKLVDTIKYLSDQSLLHDGCIIVAEHSNDVSLPEAIGLCRLVRRETYGMIGVTIYTVPPNGTNRPGE
ncbi:16S rRNA (guanine(966)-N(2))-methyltransferase RsmD [Bacillus marinisedimentorum]|uniref:16S rRNA (guanine(966)-N(2))-methyltransferase RsmD n=1 Tax=Bacillus marinisedimentorum TaxID=1821260 RepID=UPI00087211B5|nr:16S rRNA (guanine(966)-N(2))-methyltransferase RsmD [Bacillus marinisedimentorum]